MTHVDPEQPVDETKPVVSQGVRRAVYVAALVVGVLSLLLSGLAEIWWPDLADEFKATADVILGVIASIAGALGISYLGKRG